MKRHRRKSKIQTNAWLSYLERFRRDNPDVKGKEVMRVASESYERGTSYRARMKTAGRPVKMHSSFAGEEDVCPICHEIMRPMDQCWACNLKHIFHCGCIYKWMDAKEGKNNCVCPICREPLFNLNNIMPHSEFMTRQGRPKKGFVKRIVPRDCRFFDYDYDYERSVYIASTPKPRLKKPKAKRPSS